MNNKRAYGHLEMIIAFTLFVGFIGFLIIFVKPSDNSTLSDSVNLALKDSFFGSVKTNYTRFFISINSQGSSGCFLIDLDERAFKYPSVGGFVEKAISHERINSNIKPNYEIAAAGGEGSYYVSISPEFNISSSSVICSSTTSYTFGSIDEKNMISRTKLDEIKGRYKTDYNGLKSDLGLPSSFDFAILSDDLPEVSMDRDVPDKSEVVATESFEDVLFSNGEIRNVKFIFKVW